MKLKKDEVVWLLIFIAPAIGLFFLFFILPILFLFVTSFTNWDGIGAEFVGLENYSKLLNKKSFIRAITNNLYWCVTAALITVPLALIVALLLAHSSRGWKVFRTVLFIPQVVSSAAIATEFAISRPMAQRPELAFGCCFGVVHDGEPGSGRPQQGRSKHVF